MNIIDIIIPTWNNPQYLGPCIKSIMCTAAFHGGLAKIIIVNNGKQPCKEQYAGVSGITVIDAPDNLGWEGGLNLGLKHSSSPFVVFQNDDTFIPQSCPRFYELLLYPFNDMNVAAVGPSTTVAAGVQSIYHPGSPLGLTEVAYQIYFAVMVRREYLDKVGGVDESLPGGDDFDLSIRFRKAGHKLLVNPGAFLIHHGFKTGERVRGGHTTDGGWNSPSFTDRVNHALIVKHGFKQFFSTIVGQARPYNYDLEDKEGIIIRDMISASQKVLEVGCGARKTVPWAYGIDKVKGGDKIDLLEAISVADEVADASTLPFPNETYDVVVARHILEHCIDPVKTLREWRRVLKKDGILIFAVPDETLGHTIPMNPEHVHAFTAESVNTILEAVGYERLCVKDTGNGVSFVGSYKKVPVGNITISSEEMVNLG